MCVHTPISGNANSDIRDERVATLGKLDNRILTILNLIDSSLKKFLFIIAAYLLWQHAVSCDLATRMSSRASVGGAFKYPCNVASQIPVLTAQTTSDDKLFEWGQPNASGPLPPTRQRTDIVDSFLLLGKSAAWHQHWQRHYYFFRSLCLAQFDRTTLASVALLRWASPWPP